MRFKEFRPLTEEKENVVIIGDSIADGIASAGGASKEYIKGGKGTSFVLQNLVTPFVNSGKAKGSTVILSSGAANSANVSTEDGEKFQSENLDPVAKQIKMLKDAGASISLVGVASGKTPPQNPTQYTKGKKWIVDYTGMNSKLSAIASANGATFLGPLEDFDPNISKGDGIHPYNGYQKLFQAGSAKAGNTAASQARPQTSQSKIYSIGDSHAVAVASAGKFEKLATNGRSAFSQDNDAAIATVPENSVVVLSAGANDMLNQDKEKVSNRVNDLISRLKEKKAKVYYILFAETDNPKFAKDRNQLRQLVKSNLPSGIEVIDMGKLSVEGGGDGIHAPSSWYSGAATSIKTGSSSVSPLGNPSQRPGAPATKNKNGGQGASPSAGAEGTPLTQIEVPTGRVGKDIADIQKTLVALGYELPKHGVDGIRGPETSTAIRAFQKDNNLTVDGDPGPETVGKLNSILKSKPELSKKLTKSSAADVKSAVPDRDLGSYAGNARAGLGETGSAKEAVSFFVSKGWTPEQAAGIVGNLQAESGANLRTDAVGDGGKAYGIAQWHPDRQAKFRRAFGKDIREAGFKEQLQFVQWELENDERNAAAYLRRARTAEQAAWVFDEYYERSSGAHRQRRIDNALALVPRTTATA
jgi:peptidoglycan hydrolase-like protein with peptidoglycan-binding domain